MLLGGLWHGARYNFVLWGAYHGLLLVVHRLFSRRFARKDRPAGPLINAMKIVVMFQFTLGGWLLFRVETMEQLRRMIIGLMHNWTQWDGALTILGYMLPVTLPLVVVQAWQAKSGDLECINRAPWPVRSAFAGVCIAAVLLINRSGGSPFIYFQF
jgi:alginate O-acetyltransferase complex protein AlgI